MRAVERIAVSGIGGGHEEVGIEGEQDASKVVTHRGVRRQNESVLVGDGGRQGPALIIGGECVGRSDSRVDDATCWERSEGHDNLSARLGDQFGVEDFAASGCDYQIADLRMIGEVAHHTTADSATRHATVQ